MSIDQASATVPPSTATVTVTAPAPIKAFSEGDDGPSFKDVIDIINPLQHIPVINTIYRHLTGDEEGAVADVGGGALYMGPVGLIGSLVDLAVRADSGKSIGDNILSWLGLAGDDDAPADAAQTAQAQTQQQVQQQQTAAVTAPLPAITAQALAALPARQRGDDRKDADRREGKDSPTKVGDYMVFGAAGSGQPLSLPPSQPDAENAATTPDSSGLSRKGNYLVFGDTQSVPTPVATASASVKPPSPVLPVGSNATAPVPVTPPGLTPLPTRAFAAPARRTQVTPNALPMPTTGPAAIPGHLAASQAIPAQPMSGADASWFVSAMNNGLDKYAAAQKLTDQTGSGADSSAQTFATIH